VLREPDAIFKRPVEAPKAVRQCAPQLWVGNRFRHGCADHEAAPRALFPGKIDRKRRPVDAAKRFVERYVMS
jgi:hypothetical protein